MLCATLERPNFSKNKRFDETDSNETILLAVPPKPTQNRYRFKQMLDYCKENNKQITELTFEEKKQFII